MKYIEELDSGDAFSYKNHIFILTSDFRNSGERKGISLTDGLCRWFNGNTVCELIDLFIIDKNSNIIKVKSDDKDAKKDSNIF